jgi:hypothetical protein
MDLGWSGGLGLEVGFCAVVVRLFLNVVRGFSN